MRLGWPSRCITCPRGRASGTRSSTGCSRSSARTGEQRLWRATPLASNASGEQRLWRATPLASNASGEQRLWRATPLASNASGEQRLWRATPLASYRVIVDLIGATTTKTGLSVRCELDPHRYPKGVVVSDAEIAALNIEPDEFHGEWNYTISSRQASS